MLERSWDRVVGLEVPVDVASSETERGETGVDVDPGVVVVSYLHRS